MTLDINHASYPINLKLLDYPPQKLYLKGKIIKKDQKAVAIVGTRKMTTYGKNTAELFVTQIAKADITIVSGMARGIDSVVHKSALAAGGRTIAVLGSGINVIYPPENKGLYNQIIDSNQGAIVSIFPSDTKPYPNNFLERNAIISGLSLATIIVEGARRSGTISTAAHAANQNKEVFAIPGPQNSVSSQATRYLFEQGATLVTDPQVVIDYINSIS